MASAVGIYASPDSLLKPDTFSTDEYVAHLSTLMEQGAGVLDCHNVSLMPNRLLDLLGERSVRVLHSSEGLISVVREEYSSNDFSQQSGNFDFHTDGLIYDQVPEFVLLYCVDPGAGVAQTVIADSRRICQKLSEAQLSVLAQCETEYINKAGAVIRHKLLVTHPQTGEQVINIGTRGLVRPWITQDQERESQPLRDVIRALGAMYDLLDESVVYQHQWKQGDALLIDNYAYLHARSAIQPDPNRKLLRIWLSRQ